MTKRKISNDDVVRVQQRKSIAQRRVGEGARCATCGESRPEALISGSTPMTCAECQRRRDGLPTTDAHHVGSKNNSSITIEMPTNDHRADLSVAQYKWPTLTLENPNGDPITAVAGWLRGAADVIVDLVHKFVIKAAECLETVAAFLTTTLGEQYWIGTPLQAFAPRR